MNLRFSPTFLTKNNTREREKTKRRREEQHFHAKGKKDDEEDDVRDDVLLRLVAVRFLRSFVVCGGNARVGNDDAIVLRLFLGIVQSFENR